MSAEVILQRPEDSVHELSPRASFYTALLAMLFGANAVAVKISLVGLGVFTNAGIRFGIASICIFLYARLTKKSLVISAGQMLRLFPIGLLFFGQLSLFYLGLNTTTASHGTLIANALPFVVMILAHFFIPGDTITLKKVSGLFLGFAGVLVLFGDRLTLTADVLQGDLCILMAVLVWGCNVICVKRAISGFHPVQITLYPMIMATPLFILSGLLWDSEMIRFADSRIVAAMVYQTLVTASFGLVAWNSMVRKYGSTALHSFVFIMPIAGVFFGVVLLGEPVTVNLIASIVLVTAGLIVVHKRGRGRN